MALKGYDTEQTLSEVAGAIKAEVRRIDGGVAAITAGKNNLAGMASTYGPFKAELAAIAAANPDDPAWQTFNAKMDLYAAEFVGAKDWAILLEAALTGIDKL